MAFYDEVQKGMSDAQARSFTDEYLKHGNTLSNKPDPNQGPMYDDAKFQEGLERLRQEGPKQTEEETAAQNDLNDTAMRNTSDIEADPLPRDKTTTFVPEDEQDPFTAGSGFVKAFVEAMPNAERTKHSEWYEYLTYKYQDEQHAAEEKRIADVLGLDPKMIFGNRELYQDMAVAAAKAEKMAKLKNLYKEDGSVDIDKVYQNIPGFEWILKNQGPLAAAMAVANMDGIAKINEVYDSGADQFWGSIKAGAERGVLQTERNKIGSAALKGVRALTPDEQKRIKEIDAKLAEQYEMSYSNVFDTAGGMLGEAASQGSLFIDNIIGKITGTAVGAGTLAVTKNPKLAMTAGKWSSKIASIALMTDEMAGAHYLENLEKLDKNGNAMYTPAQAAALSGVQGAFEGVIEEYTIAQYLSGIFSSGGKKHLTEYITKSVLAGESEGAVKKGLTELVRGAIKGGVMESLALAPILLSPRFAKKVIGNAAAKAGEVAGSTLKASSGELYEEMEQQLSSMVVENIFQAFIKGDDAEYYSLEQIAGETLAAGFMAISATGGFFLAGAPIKAITGTQQYLKMRENISKYAANKYFKDAVENDHRINTIESVQNAIKDGALKDLQDASPQTVEAMLDAKNRSVEAETTMVDIKALSQMEGGSEILKQLAKAAGVEMSEVEDHLRAQDSGMMAVKTSKLMLMQQDQKFNEALKGNVAHNLKAMTDNQRAKYAKEVQESMKLLRKLNQVDTDHVAEVINENFTTDNERQLAEIILGSKYGNDVDAGMRAMQKELSDQYDELLAYEIGKLMDEGKQGTAIIDNTDRDDVGAVKRVNQNYEWYKKWWKDHPGKKWSKNEARYIAYEAINGRDPYGVGFYYGIDDEGQAELDKIKEQVNTIQEQMDLLKDTAFRDKMNTLSINNIMDTADLSPEAQKHLVNLTESFKAKNNGQLTRAAAVNAIMLLHYMEARVAARQAAGQKDWTLDKQMEKVKWDISGNTASQPAQQTMFQAMFGEEVVDQMAEVRAKYEGTDQWLKAPNGADTNLTEEQWLVVRTPNFINWFGNWEAAAERDAGKLQGTSYTVAEAEDLLKEDVAAKLQEIAEDYGIEISLVDAKLHGSRTRFTAREDSDLDLVVEYSGDISEDELFNALNEDPIMLEGIQVDVNPITASDTGTLANYLARDKQYDAENGISASKVVDENGEPKVMYHGTNWDITPDNATFETDLIYISADKNYSSEFGDNVYQFFINARNPLYIDEDDGIRDENGNTITIDEDPEYPANASSMDESYDLREYVDRNGYDMVFGPDMFMATIWDPTNIKSATDNNGNFDPNSSNFLEQTAYHGTAATFDKFDLGYLGTGEGNAAHGWGLYFARNRATSERYREVLSNIAHLKPSVKFSINGIEYSTQGYEIQPTGEAESEIGIKAINAIFPGWINPSNLNPLSTVDLKEEFKRMAERIEYDLSNGYRSDEKYIEEDKELLRNCLTTPKHEATEEEINSIYDVVKKVSRLGERSTTERNREIAAELAKELNVLLGERKAKALYNKFEKKHRYLPNIVHHYETFENYKIAQKFLNELNYDNISDYKIIQPGSLFEVDIPEESVMLDEQALLKDQGEYVRECLEKLKDTLPHYHVVNFNNEYGPGYAVIPEGGEIGDNTTHFIDIGTANDYLKATEDQRKYVVKILNEGEVTGRRLYRVLAGYLGNIKAASLALKDAGLEGITYDGLRDGRSFVVFNDQAVDVIAVNDEVKDTQPAQKSLFQRGTNSLYQKGDLPKAAKKANRKVKKAEKLQRPITSQYQTSKYYTKLSIRQQEVIDEFISTDPDGARIKANLDRLGHTPWANACFKCIMWRKAMDIALAGGVPDFESMLTSPGNIKGDNGGLYGLVKAKGVQGAWEYCVGTADGKAGAGFLAGAAKPIHAVSGSFINCNPSLDCATWCYSANQRGQMPSVINKGELVNFLIERYPEEAAKRIAKEYTATLEYDYDKALRILDRGELSARWLPFVEEMNRRGIRLQIFTKRAELLSDLLAIEKRTGISNVTMLSVDQSNAELADQYKDVALAFVWAGPQDNERLEKEKDRYLKYGGVILPVVVNEAPLPPEIIAQLPKWANPYSCIVDKGLKQVGNKNDADTYWNCTKCDRYAGIGCFHGKVTAKILQEARELQRAREAGLPLPKVSDEARKYTIQESLAVLENMDEAAQQALANAAVESILKEFMSNGKELNIDENTRRSIFGNVVSRIRAMQGSLDSRGTQEETAAVGGFDGGSRSAASGDQRQRRSLNQRVAPKLFQADDRELVVLHGTYAHKLRKALKSGGLAMPSLAITKHDLEYNNFGDITFVGTKDMIDPAVPGNRVFSRDAYTVRTPKIKNQRLSDAEIDQKLSGLKDVLADFDKFTNKGEMWASYDNVRWGALKDRDFKDNVILPYYYATRVKGEKIELHKTDYFDVYLSDFGYVNNELLEVLKSADLATVNILIQQVPKILPAVKKAINETRWDNLTWEAVEASKGITFQGGKYIDISEQEREERYVNQAIKLIEKFKKYEYDNKYHNDYDEDQLLEDLNQHIDDAEYNAWLNEFTDSLHGDPMIQDENGNYTIPATLDNIVEQMKLKSGAGHEFSWLYPAVVAAMGSKQFASIEEMREWKDTLRSNEEVERAIDDNDTVLENLKDKAATFYSGLKDAEQEFYQAIVDVIADSYEAEPLVMEVSLENHGLSRWDYLNVNWDWEDEDAKAEVEAEYDDFVKQTVDAANKTRKLITQYYEAKPERAVYFNEFVGAAVPADIDPEIIQQLQAYGLQVETYGDGGNFWNKDAPEKHDAIQKIVQSNDVLFQEAQDRYEAHSGIKGATEYSDPDENGDYGELLIRLFETADESTFMHELGHVYLLELQELAALDPNGQAAADVETVKKWASWKEGQLDEYKGTASYNEFAARDAEIREARRNGYVMRGDEQVSLEQLQDEWIQERFARGFEMYLQKGQAPTPTLKRAFRKFKTWLVKIYQNLIGAGATPSPEVEAVMARAFATQEVIDATAELNKINNLDLDDDLSNEDLRAMHERWKEEAKEEAKERILAKLLKVYKKDIKDKVDQFEKEARERITQELRDQYRCYNVDDMVAEGVPLADALEVFGFMDGKQFTAEQEYRQEKRLAGGGEPLDLEKAVDKKVKAEVKNFKEQMPSTQQLQEMAEVELANDKAADVVALEAEILDRREKRYMAAGAKLMTAFDEVDKAIKGDNPAKLQRKIQELKYANEWSAAELELLNDMDNALRNRDKARLRGAEKRIEGLEEKYDKLKQMTLENVEWLRGIRDAAKGRSIILREQANSDMGEKEVHEAISVGLWNREQQKAAAEAYKKVVEGQRLKAQGKTKEAQAAWDEAYKAKLQQTYYAAMTTAAAKASKEVEKYLKKIKDRQRSLSNKGAVKLDAAARYYYDHLLYLYGINKIDARMPSELPGFNEFWSELTSDVDTELQLDPGFAAIAEGKDMQKNYKHLTMDQFRELNKVLNVIYTLGRNKNMLLTMDVDMDTVRAECRKAFSEHIGNPKEEKTFEELSKLEEWLGDYEISLLRPELMLKIAGGNEQGFHKFIYMILQKASENEALAKEEEAKEFGDLINKYYSLEERGDFNKAIDGVTLPDGSKLTKNMLLSMALNWGNKTNQARLYTCLFADREGNLPNQQRAFAGTQDYFVKYMTEKDWTFVQAVWDHLDKYGDKVNTVVEKLNGVPMKRVQADSFDILTADGKMVSLRGGYYPLVSNPRKDSTVNEQQEIEDAAAGRQSLGTGMGSTKERAASLKVNRPLLLDLSVISRHINQQIHIANMRLACRDAYKVLNDRTIKNMLEAAWGVKGYNAMKQWILDTWKPDINKSVVEHLAGQLRGNTVTAIMAYRMGTAVLNFANIAPMINELGAMDAMQAMLRYATHFSEMREFVFADSVIMRNRAENLDTDLNHVQDDAFDPTDKFHLIIDKYANWFIAQTDMITSIPLYWWRYHKTLNQALAENMDAMAAKDKAHFEATQAVRNVLGSTDQVDRAAIQREKSEFARLFIPFYTFSSTMYNAVAEKYYAAAKGGSNEAILDSEGNMVGRDYDRGNFKARYGQFIKTTMLLYMLMPAIETALRMAIDAATDGPGDDDKDPNDLLFTFVKEWGKNSISSGLGAFYGINLIVESLLRVLEGGYSTGRGSMGVLGGAASRAERAVTSAAKLVQGKTDLIDFGRDLTKAYNAWSGTPDTLTDFLFNTARFVTDDTDFNDMDAWREYIAKSIFDRKLKKKK